MYVRNGSAVGRRATHLACFAALAATLAATGCGSSSGGSLSGNDASPDTDASSDIDANSGTDSSTMGAVDASADDATVETDANTSPDANTTAASDASADASTCGPSLSMCGASCTNTTFDPDNCGACGHACGSTEVCASGSCATHCASGQQVCTTDGGSYCASTDTDNDNCGVCGQSCAAGQVCSGGACSATCGSSQTLCSPDGGAPYCASTQTDNVNCGVCGKSCSAGEVCSGGACSATCGSSETLCAPDGGSPYCAITQTDNANCGVCGKVCPSGQACSAGGCTTSCLSPQSLCTPDGGASECTDLHTDNANCGVCGKACPLGQGCAAGVCSPGCFTGGIGTACTVNSQCASDSCTTGTCQALGALVLNQVDGPYVAVDAFNNGTIYTYVAFGPNGATPTIVGGTGATFAVHAGGGVNSESSFQITSSTPVTSITISTATRSTFTVHLGSLFFDGTFDPSPATATHTIPAGQSVAWGVGFSEDLGTSNWYASVDGIQTPYTQNVHVHSFSAPISPGTTHAVMGAGYASGSLGIQAAYWGYSHDVVSCP
jgi:hypothetical protein